MILFLLGLRIYCTIVGRSQSHCVFDVVCKLLLLILANIDQDVSQVSGQLSPLVFASSVVFAAATRSASLMIVVEFSEFSSSCGN